MKKPNLIVLSIILFLVTACSKKPFQEKTQTPKYSQSQEVKIETADNIFIAGSLEYVDNDQLIIFIAGSGPTDRDCNNSVNLKTDAFKMLAAHLYSKGISTFRFDKRGIGASTPVQESTMTIESFVHDVEKIISYFKNDFKEIILLGHSEGSLIGSIAAKSENVHSFISIAGPSKRMDEVLIDQLGKYPALVPLAKKHIDEINKGEPLSEVNPLLQSLFRESLTPFLKSVFSLNPSEEIGQLNKPILIIIGVCDLQVPVEHAYELHKASQNSKIVEIVNMGHAMKELEQDCGNQMDAYTDAALPLNKIFTSSVYEFISQN